MGEDNRIGASNPATIGPLDTGSMHADSPLDWQSLYDTEQLDGQFDRWHQLWEAGKEAVGHLAEGSTSAAISDMHRAGFLLTYGASEATQATLAAREAAKPKTPGDVVGERLDKHVSSSLGSVTYTVARLRGKDEAAASRAQDLAAGIGALLPAVIAAKTYASGALAMRQGRQAEGGQAAGWHPQQQVKDTARLNEAGLARSASAKASTPAAFFGLNNPELLKKSSRNGIDFTAPPAHDGYKRAAIVHEGELERLQMEQADAPASQPASTALANRIAEQIRVRGEPKTKKDEELFGQMKQIVALANQTPQEVVLRRGGIDRLREALDGLMALNRNVLNALAVKAQVSRLSEEESLTQTKTMTEQNQLQADYDQLSALTLPPEQQTDEEADSEPEIATANHIDTPGVIDIGAYAKAMAATKPPAAPVHEVPAPAAVLPATTQSPISAFSHDSSVWVEPVVEPPKTRLRSEIYHGPLREQAGEASMDLQRIDWKRLPDGDLTVIDTLNDHIATMKAQVQVLLLESRGFVKMEVNEASKRLGKIQKDIATLFDPAAPRGIPASRTNTFARNALRLVGAKVGDNDAYSAYNTYAGLLRRGYAAPAKSTESAVQADVPKPSGKAVRVKPVPLTGADVSHALDAFENNLDILVRRLFDNDSAHPSDKLARAIGAMHPQLTELLSYVEGLAPHASKSEIANRIKTLLNALDQMRRHWPASSEGQPDLRGSLMTFAKEAVNFLRADDVEAAANLRKLLYRTSESITHLQTDAAYRHTTYDRRIGEIEQTLEQSLIAALKSEVPVAAAGPLKQFATEMYKLGESLREASKDADAKQGKWLRQAQARVDGLLENLRKVEMQMPPGRVADLSAQLDEYAQSALNVLKGYPSVMAQATRRLEVAGVLLVDAARRSQLPVAATNKLEATAEPSELIQTMNFDQFVKREIEYAKLSNTLNGKSFKDFQAEASAQYKFLQKAKLLGGLDTIEGIKAADTALREAGLYMTSLSPRAVEWQSEKKFEALQQGFNKSE